MNNITGLTNPSRNPFNSVGQLDIGSITSPNQLVFDSPDGSKFLASHGKLGSNGEGLVGINGKYLNAEELSSWAKTEFGNSTKLNVSACHSGVLGNADNITSVHGHSSTVNMTAAYNKSSNNYDIGITKTPVSATAQTVNSNVAKEVKKKEEKVLASVIGKSGAGKAFLIAAAVVGGGYTIASSIKKNDNNRKMGSPFQQIKELGSSLAASVSPITDRMSSKDSNHDLQVNDSKANINNASISTRVNNTEQPLDRSRVEEIYSNQSTRGIAF